MIIRKQKPCIKIILIEKELSVFDSKVGGYGYIPLPEMFLVMKKAISSGCWRKFAVKKSIFRRFRIPDCCNSGFQIQMNYMAVICLNQRNRKISEFVTTLN